MKHHYFFSGYSALVLQTVLSPWPAVFGVQFWGLWEAGCAWKHQHKHWKFLWGTAVLQWERLVMFVLTPNKSTRKPNLLFYHVLPSSAKRVLDLCRQHCQKESAAILGAASARTSLGDVFPRRRLQVVQFPSDLVHIGKHNHDVGGVLSDLQHLVLTTTQLLSPPIVHP